jgi:hypothetical protein
VPEAHNHCQQPHISSKEPSSSYCSYHFLLEISIYSQHHQGNNISLKSICNTKKYPLHAAKAFSEYQKISLILGALGGYNLVKKALEFKICE